jgi:hypothetical protein
MVHAVTNATQAQPVTPPSGTPPQKPARTEPKPATDSVQLSKTAQAAAAALQESTENSTQTGQEASHGDLQAQRLLAKEAAAKPPTK